MATTRATRIQHVAGICLILLSAALASCGGGAFNAMPSAQQEWPEHSWDNGIRAGSYVAVAVDEQDNVIPELTAKLALDVVPQAGGELVRIRARGLEACNYVGLHLRYERQQRHPRRTQCGRGMEQTTLLLGVTSVPGTVALGLTTVGSAPLLSGDVVLAEVEFAAGPMLGERHTSLLCKTPVTDLAFSPVTQGLLEWSYNSPGDANQDSVVNTADVVPLGVHFGKTTASLDWAAARVADTSRDGAVTVADLTPIGIHFLERVSSYQVLDCATETGQFDPVAGASVAFNLGLIPGGGGFKQFMYQLTAATEGRWYAVIAMEDANLATAHSNAVQYTTGGPQPPLNLHGTSDGTNIQLAWDLPASGAPDSYSIFLSNTSDMAGALQLNGSPITLTQFTVPVLFPPTNEYYFAATAVNAAISTPYSNIFHYIPGGDAPQNLIAQRVTDHIQLDWDAPVVGTPDGYNAYIGSDDTLSDAFKLNPALITDVTFDVSTLFSPDTIHYFGVKASTSGTESGFSNICLYDPGAGPDTDPPVWQGTAGILSVAPDDSLVTVTWSAAVDAQTPPVQYLLYYVEDGQPFDWNNPNEIYDSSIKTANVLGLTNDVKYNFAVRAQDSVAPTPNMTVNVNFLGATPMIFPDDGQIGTLMASDVASVRMPGEEIPRIVAVNHLPELWYCVYDGVSWIITDLNTIIGDPARKYHPQVLAVGDDVHIVYGTSSGMFEIFGPKDADPSTWTQKPIAATGLNGIFGIGFSYSEPDGYLAVVYATKTGTEQLYYSDRDLDGEWMTPLSIMDGNPELWQCDMALNQYDGSQWVVASNGDVSSTADDLKFYYLHRDSRSGVWTGGPTGYGGDVMVVEIDPTIHQPVVVNAEVRVVDVPLAGPAPVSDATVFTWDGSAWLKNVLEQGDVIFNDGDFTLETILTGQDPQLVFSPTGKAVALWSKLDLMTYMLDDTTDMTGDWRYGQRTDTTWGTTKSMLAHICSSNAVTAGDGYQHCVTCDIGFLDSGATGEIFDKYSARNDYVEGELYYHRQTW